MEKVDMLLEPIRVLLIQLGHFVPLLALAIAILIGGWLIAKVVRVAVIKGLRAVNAHVLTERAGIDSFLTQGGVRSDMTDILGGLVYWLVILAALLIAFNSLGLTYITELLRQIVLFVPKVIVGLLIIVFGSYFARFIGATITAYMAKVGVQDADLLARLAQYAILAFVVLIAIDQMDIGGEIVKQTFLILLGGVVLALALAFGIGGQKWAARLLDSWYPDRREDRDS